MGAAKNLDQNLDVKAKLVAVHPPAFRYEYATDLFWITLLIEATLAIASYFKPFLIAPNWILDVNFGMPLIAALIARDLRSSLKYYAFCSGVLPLLTVVMVSLVAVYLYAKGIPLLALKVMWMMLKATFGTWALLQAASLPCAGAICGLKHAWNRRRRARAN